MGEEDAVASKYLFRLTMQEGLCTSPTGIRLHTGFSLRARTTRRLLLRMDTRKHNEMTHTKLQFIQKITTPV